MKSRDFLRVTCAAVLSAWLGGCTHLSVSDCPEPEHWYQPFAVLGQDVPRVRSASYRMAIPDRANAAARFAPYALMSAYAYYDKEDCPKRSSNPTLLEAQEIHAKLARLDPFGPFDRKPALEDLQGCEDNLGLMYHVWYSPRRNELVIAFRGTSGGGDWWYGNLWPLSRWFTGQTQYDVVRARVGEILVKAQTGQEFPTKPKVVVTGHSLGGGLAQHALYSHPKDIHQAIVFDPSIITGYTSIDGAERVALCNCANDLGAEAPIIRIYESYEILSNMRIFHKLFFPAHLYIQEVRFAYDQSLLGTHSHNMAALANSLALDALQVRKDVGSPWYASADSQCTKKFEDAQSHACRDAFNSPICRTHFPPETR